MAALLLCYNSAAQNTKSLMVTSVLIIFEGLFFLLFYRLLLLLRWPILNSVSCKDGFDFHLLHEHISILYFYSALSTVH